MWACGLLVASGACSKPAANAPAAAASAPAASAASTASAAAHTVVAAVPTAVGSAPSIVVLEPAPSRDLPLAADPAVMDQVQKMFTPDILFARAGQPVEFRNSDDELHNVNVTESATKDQVFNVAIVPGTVYRHTFDQDGLYEAHCDIHQTMAAVIVVASSPYAKLADADGHVEFDEVEPGAYTAIVYAGARTLQRAFEVSGPRTELTIKN